MSTSEKSVKQHDLVLAVVENGDVLLFLDEALVVAGEYVMGDSTDLIRTAAKRFAEILDATLCEVLVPVPAEEEWSWDSVRTLLFEPRFRPEEIPIEGLGPHTAFPEIADRFETHAGCYLLSLGAFFNNRVQQLENKHYRVMPDNDQPGRFWFEMPDGERSDISYDSEVLAWDTVICNLPYGEHHE